MKKAGILGGLGPESTMMYYKKIISGYQKSAATEEYPPMVIDSVNMTEYLKYLSSGRLDSLVKNIVDSLKHLAAAGADFAAIASNTPHIVFDEVNELSPLPLISIVEETCKYAMIKNFKTVIVLGTKYTMGSCMYTKAFNQHGIQAFVPEQADMEQINSIIFPNLENGLILPEEKRIMLEIAEKEITSHGADALILGCTELPLMIKGEDLSTPLINTTQIHIDAIVKKLVQEN